VGADCGAVCCCSVLLQCVVAVCCSVLQCVLQCVVAERERTSVALEWGSVVLEADRNCNVLSSLPHTATYCNTLQHSATHRNTLRCAKESEFATGVDSCDRCGVQGGEDS